MRTRGQSYGRTPACTSWLPTPEPASTRNFSSPRERSVAGPRRLGLGGGEPVPRRTARMVGERVTRRLHPSPCPLPLSQPLPPAGGERLGSSCAGRGSYCFGAGAFGAGASGLPLGGVGLAGAAGALA